jgi:hypothetical protein
MTESIQNELKENINTQLMENYNTEMLNPKKNNIDIYLILYFLLYTKIKSDIINFNNQQQKIKIKI